MPSRTFLALAGWTAAAAAATLTGLGAVDLIGAGITDTTDGTALTSEQVGRQLDAAEASAAATRERGTSTPTPSVSADTGTSTPGPTATPTPSSASTAAEAAARRTLSTPGGTAIAACDAATVRLLSWAPAQGFGVKSADPGPDDEHAEVRFEGTAGRVELRVRCVDGRPVGSWKQDD